MIVFTLLGWMLAALFAGLYVGERGRRQDAQRREGVLSVGRVQRAVVRLPDSSVPATVTAGVADGKERYVEEAMAEGWTRADAEADWEEMMNRSGSDQPLSDVLA